ncbi:hypothetical protein ACQKPE_18605 [Pseudomonas sp. NPDC089554]|uniref:hypothetical protein n=1 Tax=Pseudomonas sp. NPDC089554 TaxID=3390653 RepID=UPI003D08F76E
MTNFEANMLALFFFVLSVVAFSVLVYISTRHIDRIESLLSKSQFVSGNRVVYSRAGLLGKVMRICTISTLLMIPRTFAKRGLADLQQVKEFPFQLRRVLVITWGVAVTSLVAFGSLDFLVGNSN